MICFVVPVQDLAKANDASCLTRMLQRTVRSVMSQADPEWRMVLVADNPPEVFGVERFVVDRRIRWEIVSFPFDPPVPPGHRYAGFGPNHLRGERDKGRKTLWGSRLALQEGVTHLMSLDCDDLVSNRVATWCRENPSVSGWWIETGWMWTEGNPWLIERIDRFFSGVCGSSNIVHSRFFSDDTLSRSFDDPSIEECGWWLPHGYIRMRMRELDEGYSPLPFRGAVYVRHGSNRSSPWSGWARRLVRKMVRGRFLSARVRREFFGTSADHP